MVRSTLLRVLLPKANDASAAVQQLSVEQHCDLMTFPTLYLIAKASENIHFTSI